MSRNFTIINEQTLHRRPTGCSQTTTITRSGTDYYRLVPMPHAPVFPVPDLGEYGLTHTTTASQLSGPHLKHFVAARYALYAALKDMGGKLGDEVLIPAYHCKAMVYPVLEAGYQPVFYKIKKDLTADQADLQTKITPRTKAALYVSYFGFFRDIEAFRDLCDNHGLIMIEDCAHSLFGEHNGTAVGAFGDYAIGSVKKFLPVALGGILTSRKPLQKESLEPAPSLRDNVKFIYNALEKSLQYGRRTGLGPLIRLAEALRGNTTPPVPPDLPVIAENQDMENRFHQTQTSRRPPRLTYWTESWCDQDRLVRRRRENYKRLLGLTQNGTSIKPLFPTLPDHVVPYMFPVIIDGLDQIFPSLEDAGIPFQRFGQFLWPDRTVEECRNSLYLSQNVLQLPCHQGLRPQEIDWMMQTVLGCVAARAEKAHADNPDHKNNVR